MKETLKQLNFVKRYDKDFIEVKHKPNPWNYDMGIDNALYQKNLETYNNATPYVYAPMLSEFVETRVNELQRDPYHDTFGTTVRHINEYKDFITQPITEESLRPFEVVIIGETPFSAKDKHLLTIELRSYITIEQAINDRVVFLFKNEEV